MRRMMGVFRLNPFAMHAHGGRGVLAPWAGGEARPLDEEPQIFEFQLALADEEEEPKEELADEGLHTFADDFEFDLPEQDEPARWELRVGYPAMPSFDPAATYPRMLHQYHPSPRRWSHPQDASFLM
ncbi:hypothetical protein C8J57DRAFT_317624 [Mycena rebaudengoi]|nr:hypothetical protein C8J57DRAFT_317624 [Mycena rebaudengoi]